MNYPVTVYYSNKQSQINIGISIHDFGNEDDVYQITTTEDYTYDYYDVDQNISVSKGL